MRLVLASTSARRRQLLEGIGLAFEMVSPDIDESRLPGEAPTAYVERVARAKAEFAVSTGVLAVGADTVVVHEGRVLGKPAHPEEARGMLQRLQGDTHQVYSGVAVAAGTQVASLIDVTEVGLLPLTDEEIADYVATGEPMGKAGAYALQGYAGTFINEVKGSPFTVIGLPVHLLPRLMAAVGAEIRSLRKAPPD